MSKVENRESTLHTQSSVLSRTGTTSGRPKRKHIKNIQERSQDEVKEDTKTRSLIPSRMKRKTELEVNANSVLKVRRKTIVLTGHPEVISKEVNQEKEVTHTTSYHVTIEKALDDDPLEDEVNEAPSALEDRGQATVDKLKEFNLGTLDDPRPIFVNILLSPYEENEYFE